MRKKYKWLPVLSCVVFLSLSLCCSCGKTASVSSENSKNKDIEVMCHYVSWFQHRQAEGLEQFRHWQWQGEHVSHNPAKSIYGNLRDICSVHYPRIGAYDSADPDVIDYHILSAKAAGIEGFIVDWYGPDNDVDFALKALFKQAQELDFKVSVCFEEKICFPGIYDIASREEALNKAIQHLKYLSTEYTVLENYWQKDGLPLILVFAGDGDWPGKGKKYFSPEEWQKITKTLPPLHIVKQDFSRGDEYLRASFAWVGNKAGYYPGWYYKTGNKLLEEGKLDFYIGSANPGFDDRGVWGWGKGTRLDARMGLDTYRRYWDAFAESRADAIQIVTWNDFQEGTTIEPTVQFGNLYLEYTKKRVNEFKGISEDNLKQTMELPYTWFVLKKFTDKEFHPQLLKVKSMLAAGKTAKAHKTLEQIRKSAGIDIPPYLDMNNEYDPWVLSSKENEEIKKVLTLINSPDNAARSAGITASSIEDKASAPEMAADGDLSTRWSSQYSDGQWLMLESVKPVTAAKLIIIWENAFAKEYTVSISKDGQTWDNIIKVKDGKKGLKEFDLPANKEFSFLKIDCLKRGTQWGFSIRELGIQLTGKIPEKKASYGPISSGKWVKDPTVQWSPNGFKLVSQTYGAVETKQQFPYTDNGIVRFNVSKLGAQTYNFTFQICMRGANGEFIGYTDPITRKTKTGENVVKVKDYKDQMKEGMSKISFKIWIEGELGGFIEVTSFSYDY